MRRDKKDDVRWFSQYVKVGRERKQVKNFNKRERVGSV